MARRIITVARRQTGMRWHRVSPVSRVKCSALLTVVIEDTQLTSQALNTDGTPRRPMNAFMIFARRRRPQVSAANQTMRTGDISKILSKEWNSMEMVNRSDRGVSCYYLPTRSRRTNNSISTKPSV
jgi:hypothetical protein